MNLTEGHGLCVASQQLTHFCSRHEPGTARSLSRCQFGPGSTHEPVFPLGGVWKPGGSLLRDFPNRGLIVPSFVHYQTDIAPGGTGSHHGVEPFLAVVTTLALHPTLSCLFMTLQDVSSCNEAEGEPHSPSIPSRIAIAPANILLFQHIEIVTLIPRLPLSAKRCAIEVSNTRQSLFMMAAATPSWMERGVASHVRRRRLPLSSKR